MFYRAGTYTNPVCMHIAAIFMLPPPPHLVQGDGCLPEAASGHDGTSQGSRDHDIPRPRGEYATVDNACLLFG